MQCPYCREDIKDGALKCKHCGTMLDEAALAPTAAATSVRSARSTGGGARIGTVEGSGQVPAWWHLAGPLAPDTIVREYKVVRLLGQGGMGEVYLGVHSLTGQKVAMKVVSPELMRDENIRRRFLEEARVMADLKHPAIVQLLAFFEEGNRFFLVMEFVDGQTLADILEKSVLPLEQSLRMAEAVLAGLQYAHTRPNPIIHRDIKPENILVGKDGKVVITDFGVAKAVGRERLTRTRGVIGTYEYMSPEQAKGDEIGPGSDIYSFGVVLYRMLTGVVPFPQKSDTGIECLTGHVNGQIPPVSEFREGLPPWVQQVLDRALAKSPQTRFASAEEFWAALRRGAGVATAVPMAGAAAAATSEAPSATALQRAQPTAAPEAVPTPVIVAPKKRTGLVAAALAAVLVAGGGGFAIWKAGLFGSSSSATDTPPAATGGGAAVVTTPPVSCKADCANKMCGPDGCGGNCGECAPGRECTNSQCACATKECAGSCCSRNEVCYGGSCCSPTCTGRNCGTDGCGGTCGSCPAGRFCKDFACIEPVAEQLWGSPSASAWNYRDSNPTKYGPLNVVDSDPSTAWCKDKGVNEWLQVTPGSSAYMLKLKVLNGYQKPADGKLGDRYSLNSRVKDVRLEFSDGTSRTAQLEDSRSWQEIDLGGVKSDWVRMVVLSYYEGRDKSVCVSEVRLEGAK